MAIGAGIFSDPAIVNQLGVSVGGHIEKPGPLIAVAGIALGGRTGPCRGSVGGVSQAVAVTVKRVAGAVAAGRWSLAGQDRGQISEIAGIGAATIRSRHKADRQRPSADTGCMGKFICII